MCKNVMFSLRQGSPVRLFATSCNGVGRTEISLKDYDEYNSEYLKGENEKRNDKVFDS